MTSDSSVERRGYCISHVLRQERSEYTWFSLLKKEMQVPMNEHFLFVTGIPGDEEKRAGMALQYPLLSASALELRFLFFYPQNNLYNKHEFHFRFLR